MRFVIEIPDELIRTGSPASLPVAGEGSGPQGGPELGALSGGAAPHTARTVSLGTPTADDTLPAGEAEYGGVSATSAATEPAQNGGPAPS